MKWQAFFPNMIHTVIGWHTKTLIPNSCVLFGNSTVQKQLELITSDKRLFDKCVEFFIFYFVNWIIPCPKMILYFEWFHCKMLHLWPHLKNNNCPQQIGWYISKNNYIKSDGWKRTCCCQMLIMTLLEKNDVNYICFTCQVIRFNKQFYSRMFHSILVQDIYNQFYLSYSMNFRDTFCKGFTWDPIQKELHIGFYFGPGSSWMLLEIILNFTWDPVQKELYFRWVIQMNLALDSCQWTLLENNFIEGCWGWSWDHLQRTLSENCSHDPWPMQSCKNSSVFFLVQRKPHGFLMRFWCTFDALSGCTPQTLSEIPSSELYLKLTACSFFLSLIKKSYFPNKFLIKFRCIFAFLMHFWCTFGALLMHFWCTFDALLVHSKVHQKCIKFKSASKVHQKCIKSASTVHQKCITNFDIVHLNFFKI